MYTWLTVLEELGSDGTKLPWLVDYVLVLGSYHLIASGVNWPRCLRAEQASWEVGRAVGWQSSHADL